MAGERPTKWLTTGWGGTCGGDGLPPGKFRVGYADPPWAWRAWDKQDKIPHRGDVPPYQPMTRDELLQLPVVEMFEAHALLFMWVVSSHVDQAIQLGEAWGFDFRTIGFVWVKTDKAGRPKMGMGRWTRQEAEVCLIFGRGRPPRLSGGVRQVLMAPAREHSRKPDEFADRIRELVGGPYLELFSRTPRFHWTVWGDDVRKFAGGPNAERSAAEAAAEG